MRLHVAEGGAGEGAWKSFIGVQERGKIFPITAKNDTTGEFAVAVIEGDDVTVQDVKSAVSVEVPKDVEGTLWQKVHTEFSRFKGVVPDEECFVGPVVELHLKPLLKEEIGQHLYRIKIPHCLTSKKQITSVKVRMGDIRRKKLFEELPIKMHSYDTAPCYEVDDQHITIYTTHFCQFVCSACHNACGSYIMGFRLAPQVPMMMTKTPPLLSWCICVALSIIYLIFDG